MRKWNTLLALVCLALPCVAQPGSPQYRIEAVGTEEVAPDLFHVMMKMEYAAARAADATTLGEKRLQEFLASVKALQLPAVSWRVTNNVMGEPAYRDRGITYSRNIVFTLPVGAAEERDRIIARLEDLGARYNSHCVTCIGSG